MVWIEWSRAQGRECDGLWPRQWGRCDPFQGEEALFDTESARVAADRRVGADDAMAGHDHRDRVASEGVAHRARRPRLADAPRNAGVGLQMTEGNASGRLQNGTQKVSHIREKIAFVWII